MRIPDPNAQQSALRRDMHTSSRGPRPAFLTLFAVPYPLNLGSPSPSHYPLIAVSLLSRYPLNLSSPSPSHRSHSIFALACRKPLRQVDSQRRLPKDMAARRRPCTRVLLDSEWESKRRAALPADSHRPSHIRKASVFPSLDKASTFQEVVDHRSFRNWNCVPPTASDH